MKLFNKSLDISLDRRSFLAAAAATAAVAGGAALTGCSAGSEPSGNTAPTHSDNTGAHSWEVAPDPIDESLIANTVEADIVIVGGGMSGLAAAATAAMEGVDAVLISKEQQPIGRGGDFAAIGSQQQISAGVEINADEITNDILDKSHFKSRNDVVRIWVDDSGEAFDWLTELLSGYGIDMFLDATGPREDWMYTPYSTCHTFIPESLDLGGNQPAVMAVMAFDDVCEKAGLPRHYGVKGEQLIKDDSGRVTAVIATNPDGEYVKYVGRKGIVLATGGYEYNDEMKDFFFDYESKKMTMMYETASSTGDGHLMGCWAGGAMEPAPHATMKFDWSATTVNNLALPRQPWLWVNAEGNRFTNEDLLWEGTTNAMTHQPDGICYSIWDNDWEAKAQQIDMPGCKRMFGGSSFWQPGMLEENIEAGNIFVADTIEELAEKIGVPAGSLKASVDRYTELAKKGHDDDFNKSPLRMTAIEEPPFYAAPLGAYVFVTLGGLLIDGQMRVMDEDDTIVEGLYAIGNCSGNFFRNGEYLVNVTGLSLGRAVTMGRSVIKSLMTQ